MLCGSSGDGIRPCGHGVGILESKKSMLPPISNFRRRLLPLALTNLPAATPTIFVHRFIEYLNALLLSDPVDGKSL